MAFLAITKGGTNLFSHLSFILACQMEKIVAEMKEFTTAVLMLCGYPSRKLVIVRLGDRFPKIYFVFFIKGRILSQTSSALLHCMNVCSHESWGISGLLFVLLVTICLIDRMVCAVVVSSSVASESDRCVFDCVISCSRGVCAGSSLSDSSDDVSDRDEAGTVCMFVCWSEVFVSLFVIVVSVLFVPLVREKPGKRLGSWDRPKHLVQ